MFLDFIKNNIIAIPTNEHNIPMVKWNCFENRFPKLEELEVWKLLNHFGYGVLCNDFTNVRCVDIDDKNDISKTLSIDYLQDLKLIQPEIYNKLYIEKTKSNGSHLIFRAKLTDSFYDWNKKLPQIKNNRGESLIDVFFKKHIVVVAPTQLYYTIQGNILVLNYLTEHEVKILIEFSQKYNQYLKIDDKLKQPKQKLKKTNFYDDDANPALLYNSTNDFKELLFKYGWQLFQRRHNAYYYTRPNKDKGTSAVFYFSTRLFYVWTTNSDLEYKRPYEPWHLFIVYAAHNNAKLAHNMLVELGYGGIKRDRINFQKTGYTEFKDYLFKQNKDSIDGIKLSNKQIYNLYLNFYQEYKFTEQYKQIAITKLLKGAAPFYGFDVIETRSRKEKFTTFKSNNNYKEKL